VILRKTVMVACAVVFPIAGVTLLTAGPAFAGGTTGTGSVTCHLGGTVNFDPPLSTNGSPASKEVTTVDPVLSGCSGGTPSASSGGTLSIKAIKTPGTGKPKTAGQCSSFDSSAGTADIKSTTSWANGAKKSKGLISGLHIQTSGSEVGFNGSGSESGSYAGTDSASLYFTSSSSSAIEHCTGSISSLTIDSSDSTISM
jgi:hypothetical protein